RREWVGGPEPGRHAPRADAARPLADVRARGQHARSPARRPGGLGGGDPPGRQRRRHPGPAREPDDPARGAPGGHGAGARRRPRHEGPGGPDGVTAEAVFAREGAVAVLTFNRPEARIAMTWAMYDALAAACDTVDGDDELRVLILRGAGGRAFVAGTDISQFRAFETPEDALDYERRMDRVITRLEKVGKPTLAAIAGVAAGGGAAIAL